MRADQTILFSDLDGTLFNTRGEVSPANRAAVERYIAAGGKFALSTGRAPKNLLRLIGGLPTNAPSVVLNGAAVCDLRTMEYAYALHLDAARVDPALRRALDAFPGLDLQLYTEDGIIYATPEETADPKYLAIHQPVQFIPYAEMAGKLVIKALLLPPPEDYDALGPLLREYAADNYELTPGTVVLDVAYRYYELMPPGVSKGSALRELRAHPELAGRTILAVGDYWNDYELLCAADVPICPANAIDEIKAVCRFVTASNDDHAIAHIIDEIIPAL